MTKRETVSAVHPRSRGFARAVPDLPSPALICFDVAPYARPLPEITWNLGNCRNSISIIWNCCAKRHAMKPVTNHFFVILHHPKEIVPMNSKLWEILKMVRSLMGNNHLPIINIPSFAFSQRKRQKSG